VAQAQSSPRISTYSFFYGHESGTIIELIIILSCWNGKQINAKKQRQVEKEKSLFQTSQPHPRSCKKRTPQLCNLRQRPPTTQQYGHRQIDTITSSQLHKDSTKHSSLLVHCTVCHKLRDHARFCVFCANAAVLTLLLNTWTPHTTGHRASTVDISFALL
jgi:hypothetical protein